MYKILVRPFLFLFSPETAHKITFTILKIASNIPGIKHIFSKKHDEVEVFGIKFPNRIGLAAGLDKDAEVFDMLGYMGFGFVEIGTVTPKAQPGNPKPRLFRLKKDIALINRMGFNNKGVDFVVNKLKNAKSKVIIGGNIGKNKITPNENAVDDYITCYEKLYHYVDYFVVNVSSPNTPNLRELQNKKPLTKILNSLTNINNKKDKPKPILLKIAPDLSFTQIDDILEIIKQTKIDGIVATNTTIERAPLSYSTSKIETFGDGGLSGKPLTEKSKEIVRYISNATSGQLPIIGVGGIMSAKEAEDMINAGASLVQIYTGFIYKGVKLINEINKSLQK